ncbi:MAG: dTDP-4-dehydrorhamnose reductase [Patescibacteria group bacterium]|jgi:dTDP-4-dehydrorhamnose reductase
MKKILIVGAKGMLGQYLAKVFRGEDLYLWDRAELDITNQAEVEKKIEELKPEIIINAAAYNDVDRAETDSETANLVNGYAVGYLAKAAKAAGAIMVHYSTGYVFDGEKVEGYTEGDQPNPISKYGQSKFLGEQELQENCERYYLIRLSRLFGDTGTGVGVKKSFVDKILELAETKEELEVVDEEISSSAYGADLAEFTKALLDDGQPFGIYHGSNSGACTWYGLAEEIFKIKGLKKKLIPVSADKFQRLARRPRYSVLLNTKFIPIRSWQESLKEYLAN